MLLLLISTTVLGQNKSKDSLKLEEEFPISLPLSLEDFLGITSNYGYRKHPILNEIKKHDGIDLAALKGKPVKATANGVVEKVDYHPGYGNRVIIKHRSKIKTLYAHLTNKSVKEGQKVKFGDVIGFVGDTGMATGPHLHYEILLDNVNIDPMVFWKLILKRNRVAKK
ncbi:M23 family metallopeptidase [Aquimarina sp. 2201CG14-23]|uniref:M23 family metallopeptidase n=1 Tax=Aquimarina mycalae TaxID=3040073 RepID=UPI0024780163|nr:M23 family metallopeptidase [Aquimarina sp. 2201CG14-23]MDH7445852.1 M23 family metallopeptidase [Aquimarina sp. 2201CG14-23]